VQIARFGYKPGDQSRGAGQRRRLEQGTLVVTPYLLWKVIVIVPVGLCWHWLSHPSALSAQALPGPPENRRTGSRKSVTQPAARTATSAATAAMALGRGHHRRA
jgi:hypothetical protein